MSQELKAVFIWFLALQQLNLLLSTAVEENRDMSDHQLGLPTLFAAMLAAALFMVWTVENSAAKDFALDRNAELDEITVLLAVR